MRIVPGHALSARARLEVGVDSMAAAERALADAHANLKAIYPDGIPGDRLPSMLTVIDAARLSVKTAALGVHKQKERCTLLYRFLTQ